MHLMEGSIDQVSQMVHINWVMPRVWSQDQVQQSWMDKSNSYFEATSFMEVCLRESVEMSIAPDATPVFFHYIGFGLETLSS
jgi:hypothetical protein